MEEEVVATPEHIKQPFWRSVYSEGDGTGSFARVGTQQILVVVLLLLIVVTLVHMAFPEPTTLVTLGVFIGTLYFGNKGSEFLSNATQYITALFKK